MTAVRPFVDTSLVESVAKRKYYQKGEDWEKLSLRVASYVASVESVDENRQYWTQEFYSLISKKIFLPGGRILANAGTNITNLSNCYVYELEDSRTAIYQGLASIAEIHAQGGGVGINFSKLREEGAHIKSTGGESSGPVSFMDLFDVSSDVIKQASRRGAMLAALNSDHPDIFKFINAKLKESKLNNFNISVLIQDSIMKAFENDEYVGLCSINGNECESVKASEILTAIAEAAWKSGEPGILFIGNMETRNPNPHLGEIVGTNPCGEIPGRNGASCILGSFDLKKFLFREEGLYVLDFAALALAVSMAVKFLDNVVDLTKSGIDLFDNINTEDRKIGLGVMGWADVLALMGMPYDSEEARQYAEETAKVIYIAARKASQILAREKGTYPGYDETKSIDPITLQLMFPQRNSNLLALAPTGTIHLISEVNESIEPFYMLAYKKNFRFGKDHTENSSIIASVTFKEVIMDNFEEDIAWEILKNTAETGTLNPSPEFSDKINTRIYELQAFFKTAYEISPEAHVLMQAAWQKYIDLSVSKTINLPKDATVEDILGVIYLAWKVGLKGMAIYRDGSRDEQIMEKPGE